MLVRVVIALEDVATQKRVQSLLPTDTCDIESLPRGRDLWDRLLLRNADLVLVGRSLVPNSVEESVRALRALPEAPEVVVVSEQEDPHDRGRLLGAGVRAVLNPTLPTGVLRDVLGSLLARRRDRQLEGLELRQRFEGPRLGELSSKSSPMQRFLEISRRLVNNDSTLLITGETGVGKEYLARAIHNEGPRSRGAFVSVNCGALSETLLESELFGHEEGAFTGASRTRRGRFELAHQGTIFLDEIGEMPTHLQVKLLHVLQAREVQRVGGDRPIRVDVRVMAATHRDLADEIEAKRFREDLFYRLSVVSLKVPPLRERREDIPDLVEKHIAHLRKRFSSSIAGVSSTALRALQAYSWPGNVRELVNVLERAMLLSSSHDIEVCDLPESIGGAGHGGAFSLKAQNQRFSVSDEGFAATRFDRDSDFDGALLNGTLQEVKRRALEDIERRYLLALLRATQGKIGEAAKRAGVQARSLFDRLRHHGIKKEDFKPERGRRIRSSER